MKMDLELDHFIEMCKIITQHKEQNDGNEIH